MNFAKKKSLYRLSRSSYEKEWGKDYVKPGVGTRILGLPLLGDRRSKLLPGGSKGPAQRAHGLALRHGRRDSLTFKFRGLFQCFHGRHGACSVVRTLCRLRTSVAFGDRIMLCHWLLRLLLTPYHVYRATLCRAPVGSSLTRAAPWQQRPPWLQVSPALCESSFGHASAPKLASPGVSRPASGSRSDVSLP